MPTDQEKLLSNHAQLTHSVDVKVTSHVQREEGDWLVNTLMIEGYDVPFRYKRKQAYKSLVGARVNLTYYPQSVDIGGFSMETMKVVRIRRS
jgi:hypothetical protein